MTDIEALVKESQRLRVEMQITAARLQAFSEVLASEVGRLRSALGEDDADLHESDSESEEADRGTDAQDN